MSMIPFVINGKYKIYGNLENIITNTDLFQGVTLSPFIYINLTITGIQFDNIFFQVWKYINGLRSGKIIDILFTGRQELWPLFRLLRVKRPFIDKLSALHESFRITDIIASHSYTKFLKNTLIIGNPDIYTAISNAAGNIVQGAIAIVVCFITDRMPYYIMPADINSDTLNNTKNVFNDNLSPENIGRTVVLATWKDVIKADNVIQSKTTSINVKIGKFNPITIVANLLDVDISLVIPMAKCFYLYSVWELLQLMPANEELDAKLQELITTYKCGDIFKPVIIPLSLSPLVHNIDQYTAFGLRDIVQNYNSRPPTREEVMERLLKM